MLLTFVLPVKKLRDLCSVQEEEGEVTKQMHQGGVLVAVVWEGEAIRMVVTTTEQEAMVSISVLSDKTKVIREWSVKRMNHSAWTWVFWSEGYIQVFWVVDSWLNIFLWLVSGKICTFKVCRFTWKEFQMYSVLFVLVYIDTLRIPLNGFYHTVRVGKFWFKLNVVNRCDLLFLWFRRAIFLLNERFSLWDCLSFCCVFSCRAQISPPPSSLAVSAHIPFKHTLVFVNVHVQL